MIRYVLLDLDDTIFDFHMAEAVAVRDTLQAFGVDVTDAIIARYSEINDAQWKRLERGEMTRDEVKRRRFEILFEELGIGLWIPERVIRSVKPHGITPDALIMTVDQVYPVEYERTEKDPVRYKKIFDRYNYSSKF
jgi:2-haloacid dehalogenase